MPLLDVQRSRIPLGLRARSLPPHRALIRNTGLCFGAFLFNRLANSLLEIFPFMTVTNLYQAILGLFCSSLQ